MPNSAGHLTRREVLKVLTTGLGAGLLTAGGLVRWRRAQACAVLRQSRPMLGTLATITIHHPELREAEAAMTQAFAAIEQVDRVMSVHRADSDLSAVNRAAGRAMVTVDPALCAVLGTAMAVHAASDGAYDVTCLPVMRLYGFYASGHAHYPRDREIYDALDAVGQRWVTVDADACAVGLTRAGAGIDLGSIGKGYAVDRAGDALRAAGIMDALIDVGGNCLAMGAPRADGRSHGWRVAVRNPTDGLDAQYFETILLRDAAVATSGNYEQQVRLDGRTVGHLFDMRTAHPAQRGVSATVVAATATMADALSTTAFLLGPEGREQLAPMARTVYFHGYA